MSTHNLYFEQEYEKYQNFYLKTFSFFGGEIFNIFEKACFGNESVWASEQSDQSLCCLHEETWHPCVTKTYLIKYPGNFIAKK